MIRPFCLLAALAVFAASPLASANTGVFNDMVPGDALLIASKGAAPVATLTVRLDAVCEADEDGPLELQLADALALKGITVDPASPITLRYETAPCETAFRGRRNLAQQDAYSATSRAYELDPPARPFSYEWGKNRRSGARLTVNLLLFKPGQSPMWSALVAARAPGQDTQDYLAQMAAFALAKLGEEADVNFELAGAGGTP